ncbi:MAG TPA: HPF/RaiA family ribosome-associated protein [Actinomycetota bacterium]|nr:HPF/RaiA family ribosome-associated protein [Actinomycetota bacterium]
MKVQINTDSNIEGHEEMTQQVEAALGAAVGRFIDQITRVEVHLSDLNSHKFGADDKRCLLEARLAGRRPTAVSHQAATVQEAIEGAADKLKNNLESTLGRLGRG